MAGRSEEGAVLKEENKRKCEGTFSAGVSDGRLALSHRALSSALCSM